MRVDGHNRESVNKRESVTDPQSQECVRKKQRERQRERGGGSSLSMTADQDFQN